MIVNHDDLVSAMEEHINDLEGMVPEHSSTLSSFRKTEEFRASLSAMIGRARDMLEFMQGKPVQHGPPDPDAAITIEQRIQRKKQGELH